VGVGKNERVLANHSAYTKQKESYSSVAPELSTAFDLPELIVYAFLSLLFIVISMVVSDSFDLLLAKVVEENVRNSKTDSGHHRYSPAKTFLVLAEVVRDYDQCSVSKSDQHLQEPDVLEKHTLSYDLLDLKIFKVLKWFDNQEVVEQLAADVLNSEYFHK